MIRIPYITVSCIPMSLVGLLLAVEEFMDPKLLMLMYTLALYTMGFWVLSSAEGRYYRYAITCVILLVIVLAVYTWDYITSPDPDIYHWIMIKLSNTFIANLVNNESTYHDNPCTHSP